MIKFYTVDTNKPGYPVKYLDSATLRIVRFGGNFEDPGEASQEFQASIGGEQSCYLEPDRFRAKVQALRKRSLRQ